MGFVDALKGVLAKVRAMGKTEKDILNAVENAAEKATVNREALRAMIEPAERKFETEAERVSEKLREVNEQAAKTFENFAHAVKEGAKGVNDFAEAMAYAIIAQQRYEKRKNTNNWRRMHGMPMKREVNRRKSCERRKRADNHPKNTNVS